MATLTLSTASPDIVYFVHGGGGRAPGFTRQRVGWLVQWARMTAFV